MDEEFRTYIESARGGLLKSCRVPLNRDWAVYLIAGLRRVISHAGCGVKRIVQLQN